MSDLQKLLKNDRYQVFLFTSRPGAPLSFGCHPWFVANKKGVVARFEILADPRRYAAQNRWGQLCRDSLGPSEGLRIFRSPNSRRWKSALRHYIEGGEGSQAQRMIEVIESSPRAYPYCERYAYTGPNSNTYVQWIVDQFPDAGFSLPWNAFGKNFK